MSAGNLSAALSLRTSPGECKAEGDLVEFVLAVDPHLEYGAISRCIYEMGSPMSLINHPKGRYGLEDLVRILGIPVDVPKKGPTGYARFAKSIGPPLNQLDITSSTSS
ncbi:3-polyprenyl-4-hydroxybenzoate decarboxylase [Penicillium chermesinum]|uniref:3-polyprenyl-4-hydroxybenzoate decarboxylase n=1 Tax=Penicillium chermesinum TaxID=63820 RepID=A0A9W9P385_9EURO|nr:3-polyprenyl-4-hydroxybenzoate decarboxylase [Penicillium chermesinum]KAJ5233173.1 3-polyprenyl-4-hydroxybenzoate decarboxylase [Penicillium chermesinum]